MATGYGGHFLLGMSQGIQSGFDMMQRRQKMDLLKREQKRKEEAEKREAEMLGQAQEYFNNVDFTTLPEEQRRRMITGILTSRDALAKYHIDIDTAIRAGDAKKAQQAIDQLNKELDFYMDAFKMGVELEFDDNGRLVFGEEARKQLGQQHVMSEAPAGQTKEGMARSIWEQRDYGDLQVAPELGRLGERFNAIDTFHWLPEEERRELKIQAVRSEIGLQDDDLDRKIGIVLQHGGGNAEILKLLNAYVPPEQAGGAAGAAYGSAEEALHMAADLPGLTKTPYQLGNGQWVVRYSSEAEGTTTGEQRTWNMANDYLFGSSDIFSGMKRSGVIPDRINNKLNRGVPLTEEEKTEVRNAHNAMKDSVPPDVRRTAEEILGRYGIPLEAVPEWAMRPAEEPVPAQEPGLWERGVNWVKERFGIGGEQRGTAEDVYRKYGF